MKKITHNMINPHSESKEKPTYKNLIEKIDECKALNLMTTVYFPQKSFENLYKMNVRKIRF